MPDTEKEKADQLAADATALMNATAEPVKACCPSCKGTGFTSKKKDKFCLTCKGSGAIQADLSDTSDCPKCEEGWKEPGTHCGFCCGTGKLVKSK